MNNFLSYLSWLAATLLLVALVIGFILSPLLVVWLVNAILNTNTPYSFESWAASIIVLILIKISIDRLRHDGNKQ